MAEALAYDDEEDEIELFDDLPVACTCPNCGDEVRLTEELFLVSFARAYQGPDGVVLSETTRAGSRCGTPWFYCFECWEALKEELQEGCEDTLPIEDVYDHGLLACDICESDICEGETFALETFGEMHWSKRSPNGVPTMVFEAMSESLHICIDCITNIEDNDQFQLEVADNDNYNTCPTGRHLRCWRDRERCDGSHCPNK